jgi:hypothetical protein
MKKKKYVLKEKVRNTVELWITEVDEDGKTIRHVAEFMDETSAKEYLDVLNKDD